MNSERTNPTAMLQLHAEGVAAFAPILGGRRTDRTLSSETLRTWFAPRLTTPLRIRILTTSDWTALQSIGDTVWSNVVIASTAGEGVTASAAGDTIYLNQPLANAQDGKFVELIAEVTFTIPGAFSRVLRSAATALLHLLDEPMVAFRITRGNLGWTHVQLINTLGDAPVVIGNEWWSNILGVTETFKQFSVERRSIFSPVEGFDPNPVDPGTLTGKVMFGYQGWFGCPNDGSDMNRWIHWGDDVPADPLSFTWGDVEPPGTLKLTVDCWPDMREYGEGERYPTGLFLPNGEQAEVFSCYNQKTVVRHFEWMKAFDLDGVFLQRFLVSLVNAPSFTFRNKVLQNVRMGAERNGRTFAVMYDIGKAVDVPGSLIKDWSFLTTYLGITDSPAYLHHNGQPVVTIWGPGFETRDNVTASEAQTAIDWFKSQGVTVMGGVPTRWRMQGGDTASEPEWAAVFRSYDIISPWSVGRYDNAQELETFRTTYLLPDIPEAQAAGADYMPVIFPGFSWHNLHDGQSGLNEAPRDGGRFFNLQAQRLLETAGVNMVYIAMFDEMDEGTAMFKLAEDSSMAPAGVPMVTLDFDGYTITADRYLQLAQMLTQSLRNQQP